MQLHTREWGSGDRLAVLVHGLTSDGGSWTRVAPALAGRGYRVVASDLRGHGLSGRGEYSPQLWADDLLDSAPAGPELAIGHSLGGIALALAVERLRPGRAVYEDPAWWVPADRHAESARDFKARKTWTREDIRRINPLWADEDVDCMLEAVGRWDPETLRGIHTGQTFDFTPQVPKVPSLVLLADPSRLVPPERAARLKEAGFEVRTVAGAGHSIHRDDLEGFFTALNGWL